MQIAPCVRLGLAFASLSMAVWGQVSTGTINLEVKDPSGALIPGAAIHLLHTATGAAREGATNDRGEFRAAFMPIGDYTITATMQGFKRRRFAGWLCASARMPT